MARVEFAQAAADDLDGLIRTHSLPENAFGRVARCLRPLEEFPRIGPELTGRWAGLRFVLGPWRWMVFVYEVLDDERVVIVTVQDARRGSGPTSSRR